MSVRLRTLLIACAIVGNSLAVRADETTPEKVQSSFALAQALCPAEVDSVSEHNEDLVANLVDYEVRTAFPGIPEDQLLAVQKAHLGSLIAKSQHMDALTYLVFLERPTSSLENLARLKNKYLAQLQFLDCLQITQQDRNLIDGFHVSAIEAGHLEVPDNYTVDQVVSYASSHLLSFMNEMECMRHNEYTRRVLSIEPTAPDVAEQIAIISEETIGRCEGKS